MTEDLDLSVMAAPPSLITIKSTDPSFFPSYEVWLVIFVIALPNPKF